jgi:hypothetical protein
VNVNEIESALDHAISALGAAKLALSKSSIPVFSPSDVLRKADGLHPRAGRSDDVSSKALEMLAELERRAEAIEGARRDMDAQTVRKTYSVRGQ